MTFRDGPAQVGELTTEQGKRVTPNIFFISSTRFHPPAFADFLVTCDKNNDVNESIVEVIEQETLKVQTTVNEFLITNPRGYPEATLRDTICYIHPDCKKPAGDEIENMEALLFIVTHGYQLLQQPSFFIDTVISVRKKIGHQKLLYFPGIGDPTSFALLTYMGIDFFDSLTANITARKGNLFFTTGEQNVKTLKELPCSCPICTSIDDPGSLTFDKILQHNYFMLHNEIKQVRNAIRSGQLRELVELRVRANPHLVALLRYLDEKGFEYLEKRIPITRKNQLIVTTEDALYRPEVKRFQHRVITRYQKPRSAKILLLLPCSAKKPYSFSKSHKKFREILFMLKNSCCVHEVILTSPLGIVPRELELIYPASSYDIPVTGRWSEDEKKMIQKLLMQYLKNNHYDHVIVHLPDTLRAFVENVIEKPLISKIVRHPTSKESLKNLLQILQEIVEPYETISSGERKRENMQALASYQFGRALAETLTEETRVTGKYPYLRIMDGKKQLGMVTKERGLISLSLEGAERIAGHDTYWVTIDNDFVLKGSVFAPGVVSADAAIRIGDEVCVFQNEVLCAVGVAQMNGEDMMTFTYGEAVNVRHKK